MDRTDSNLARSIDLQLEIERTLTSELGKLMGEQERFKREDIRPAPKTPTPYVRAESGER